MVQQVTENYDNLKIFLDLCGIPDLQFVQAMDIKCINTACGLGTPASTCPCPYCNLPKKDFLNLEQAKSGELRTFGTIRERASQYQKANETYQEQQKVKGNKVTKLTSVEYDSCEKMPLMN